MSRQFVCCLLLLLCVLHGAMLLHAQSRQPDSMKNKQLAYTLKLKQEADMRKQAQAKAIAKGPAVVAYDSKGNRVETTISKDKEGHKVTTTTTTIVMPPALNRKFNADTIDRDSIVIRVVKSKHRLNVYHKGHLLTAYKCVFGPNDMAQKKCEGDRCTPEGMFTIQNCKDHNKWDKFMLIDYPNEESWKLFEENKRKGLIPATASIGGLVGIHGIWPNGDNVIDLKHNWTDGCISLKNADVEELSKLVKPGMTKIQIVR